MCPLHRSHSTRLFSLDSVERACALGGRAGGAIDEGLLINNTTRVKSFTLKVGLTRFPQHSPQPPPFFQQSTEQERGEVNPERLVLNLKCGSEQSAPHSGLKGLPWRGGPKD